MKKKLQKNFLWIGLLFIVGCHSAYSQYTLTGQVRTRSEYRNGVGDLVPSGARPAFFTSQRTSIIFGYKWDRLTFGVNVRDVRVWGQDASSINNADGNKLFLHEGWGEFVLANSADTTVKFKLIENLSVKLGRQELVYDDSRLLGNLDWLQQGRRHDAVVVKAMHRGYQLDLGGAFNQNTDAFRKVGEDYVPTNTPSFITTDSGFVMEATPGTLPVNYNSNPPASTNAAFSQYKIMHFAYLSKKFNQTKVSLLAFNDYFQRYDIRRITPQGARKGGYQAYDYRNQVGVNGRYTIGTNVTTMIGNASSGIKVAIQAFGYYQGGKDRIGKKINAYHWGVNAAFQKGAFSIIPGYEVLSGDDQNNPNGNISNNHRFDPLYGTPHKFWGYMDYFYVGTGSPAGGLQNYFLKGRFTARDLVVSLEGHQFLTQNQTRDITTEGNLTDLIDPNLGTEIDFVINYNLNKFTNLELGASAMFATNSIVSAKNLYSASYPYLTGVQKDFQKQGFWAYLMINIRPDFLFTKPVIIKQ